MTGQHRELKQKGCQKKKQLSISPRKGNQGDKWGTEKNLWTSVKIKLTTNKLNWLLYCWQMGSSSSSSFKLYVIYLSSLPIKLQPPCLLCSSHGLLLQVPPVNTVNFTEQVCTKNMEQFTQSYQVLWICFHFEAMFENHFFLEIIIALKFNSACTKCKGSKSFNSTKKAFVSY